MEKLKLGNLYDIMNKFTSEQDSIDFLEKIRWNGNVISPYNGDSVVWKCSNNQYKCKNTNKFFNVKTGTLFENSKIKLRKWFLAIWYLISHKKGISSVQLSKEIGVTQKTAWSMDQKIRNCMDRKVGILKGIVEIDETFIGGWKKNGQGGKDKPIVMGMIQRKGKIVAKVIPNRTINTLHKIIEKNVMYGSTVMTDELPAYKSLKRNYVHKYVNHSKREYVRGNVHTNTIDGCWSHLKKMLGGTYHWVSKKHLSKYVNEFIFRQIWDNG